MYFHVKVNTTEIGKQLRNRRKNRRLSAQFLADALGCSKSTYTYYERGISSITIENLIKACDLLGLNWIEVVYNAKNISERTTQ